MCLDPVLGEPDAALRAGDLATYQSELTTAEQLVQQANDLIAQQSTSGAGGATPTPATMADGILLIIDAQREYTDGLMPLPGVQPAIEALALLLEKARKAGLPVMVKAAAGGGGRRPPLPA